VSAEKGANKRDRWLTEDEEVQLLAVCPSLLREVLVFALHSGMRLGEILALTWTGVDLFRKTVTVFHSKKWGATSGTDESQIANDDAALCPSLPRKFARWSGNPDTRSLIQN